MRSRRGDSSVTKAEILKKQVTRKVIFLCPNQVLNQKTVGFLYVKGFNFKPIEFNKESAFMVEISTKQELNLIGKLVKYDLEENKLFIVENNVIKEFHPSGLDSKKKWQMLTESKLTQSDKGQIFDKEENLYYSF